MHEEDRKIEPGGYRLSIAGSIVTVAALCLMSFTIAVVYIPGIYEYAMLPKWLAFHVCLALGCAGWLVRMGWSRDTGFISSPLNLPALCYLGVGLVSAHATTHPVDTLVELINLASLIILFFLAANGLTPKGLRPVLWTSAVVGLIVALIGILQYHHLAFSGIPSNAIPSGTFANRNLAAEYLICAIPLSGLLYLFVRRWEASLISGLAGTLMAVNLVYTWGMGLSCGCVDYHRGGAHPLSGFSSSFLGGRTRGDGQAETVPFTGTPDRVRYPLRSASPSKPQIRSRCQDRHRHNSTVGV